MYFKKINGEILKINSYFDYFGRQNEVMIAEPLDVAHLHSNMLEAGLRLEVAVEPRF